MYSSYECKWMKNFAKIGYSKAFNDLIIRYEKYIEANGNYFE